MKYLITENKLESIIFTYLDSLELEIIKKWGKVFFKSVENELLHEFYIRYDYEKDEGFILTDFVELTSNMFGLDYFTTKNIIKNWVEYKLGINIPVFKSFG